jgi:hypothetical protein
VSAEQTGRAKRGGGWQAVVSGGGLALLLALGGCQGMLVGDWHMVDGAQSKHIFSIDRASFRSDGTFTATTILDGVTHAETGTFEFNGSKLSLCPKGGGVRTYTAALGPGQLQIYDGKRRVALARGKE